MPSEDKYPPILRQSLPVNAEAVTRRVFYEGCTERNQPIVVYRNFLVDNLPDVLTSKNHNDFVNILPRPHGLPPAAKFLHSNSVKASSKKLSAAALRKRRSRARPGASERERNRRKILKSRQLKSSDILEKEASQNINHPTVGLLQQVIQRTNILLYDVINCFHSDFDRSDRQTNDQTILLARPDESSDDDFIPN